MLHVRIITLLVTLFWLVAMAELVRVEILPQMLADSVPPVHVSTDQRLQYGIYMGEQRIGTSWTELLRVPDGVQNDSRTVLQDLGSLPLLRDLVSGGVLRLESSSLYEHGELVRLEINVRGLPEPIRLTGERMAGQFPVRITAGRLFAPFEISFSGQDAAAVTDVLRPISQLSDLYVGKSWRVKSFDLLASLRARKAKFSSVLFKVTAFEQITLQGRQVRCFRLETPAAGGFVAWVDASGLLVRQEISLGSANSVRLRIEQEEYTFNPQEDRRRRRRERLQQLEQQEREAALRSAAGAAGQTPPAPGSEPMPEDGPPRVD